MHGAIARMFLTVFSPFVNGGGRGGNDTQYNSAGKPNNYLTG